MGILQLTNWRGILAAVGIYADLSPNGLDAASSRPKGVGMWISYLDAFTEFRQPVS
jgi:hypothetical protein